MPRSPRFDLAYVPQHVVQRGHDGGVCFRTSSDYRYYLEQLLRASRRWECDVHAYVLMPDHVHLLATASHVGALANMMQSIGRNYVGYFNTLYRRSGPLWEGRYHSCLVDADYVLACQRYIELNPVRARMVEMPEAYPWSSYRANALGAADPLVTPHLVYTGLGRHDVDRRAAYRHLFLEDLSEQLLAEIRRAGNGGRPLGSASFVDDVANTIVPSGATRPRGRRRADEKQMP